MKQIAKSPDLHFPSWPSAKDCGKLATTEIGAESPDRDTAFHQNVNMLPEPYAAPEQSLGVQFQCGLSWAEATSGSDSRLRVNPIGAHPRLYEVWARVGSEPTGRKAPIWCRMIVWIDRVPPDDSLIQWLYLHRIVRENSVEWKCQFVVARDNWDRPDAAPQGRVGIDLNWRVFPVGLRVATAIGSDGRRFDLFLPRKLMSRWPKSDDIRAIACKRFDHAQARFGRWLKSYAARPGNTFPSWLAAMTDSLHLWSSRHRLARLWWFWTERRFSGDETVFSWLNAWRKQDKHLGTWEDNNRRKAAAIRTQLYRDWVASLRRQYRVARIENTNWASLGRLPDPEQTDESFSARLYARVASPGRLAELIRYGFASCEEVPAEWTSRHCVSCGHINKQWNLKDRVIHQCKRCGGIWDQDENAARNLLEWVPRGGDRPRAAM